MIKRIGILICALGALSLTVTPAVMAKERTPSGSFLKYRACTVSELKSEITKDPAARIRYAQHFRSTSDEMMSCLNGGVKLVSLKNPTKVQMWYVGKDGSVRQKIKLLPKGSYVFATSDGTPFLAWSCGNPLRASLPARMAMKQPKPSPKKPVGGVAAANLSKNAEPIATLAPPQTPTPAAAETLAQGVNEVTKDIITKVLPAPIEVISSAAVTAPPELVAGLTPTVASIEPLAAIPVAGAAAIPATAAIAPTAIGGGSALGGFGLIGGLAGLAGAVAALGGGGGNHAATLTNSLHEMPPVTPPVTPPDDKPALVPEPSSFLALAMATSAAGALCSRRRASSRKS
ncbi:MAG: hypothetical protein M1133_13385 [Armatimonadetes bacterium]|nr:hypothetical protein [Armatimonadota bacterium]